LIIYSLLLRQLGASFVIKAEKERGPLLNFAKTKEAQSCLRRRLDYISL